MSNNHQFVWSISSDSAPGGFRTGVTRPACLFDGGSYELLTPIEVDGNPLHDISWADGNGIAVGHFGILGDRRRPAIASPSPTLAIIDVNSRSLRSNLSLASIFGLLGEGYANSRMRRVGCTRLVDGRVRFIADIMIELPVSGQSRGRFVFGVVVWTEGEAPKLLTDPYFSVRPASPTPRMALSPDGLFLLVDFDLVASGDPGGCSRDGQCFPESLTPIAGLTHGLYDIDANMWRWRKTATASNSYYRGTPSFSQDGRSALIYLPEICNTETVGAVVDVSNGRLIKRILLDDSSRHAGFIDNQAFVAYGGRYIVHNR